MVLWKGCCLVLCFSIVSLNFAQNIPNNIEHSSSFDDYKIPKPQNGCKSAWRHPDVNATKLKCYPYMHRSLGFCRDSLKGILVYATPREQKKRESSLTTFRIESQYFRGPMLPVISLSDHCHKLINDMYCHFFFPRCDFSMSKARPQPLCKEACRELKRRCGGEWVQVQKANLGVIWNAQYEVAGGSRSYNLMRCKGLPKRRGGTEPECYFPKILSDEKPKKPQSTSCFHGDGRSYRGNVTTTRSGFTCQDWAAQCPHRHSKIVQQFPELVNAGNACRNPGSQAPHGPWCYTTNRKVRWEYCYVPKCRSGSKGEKRKLRKTVIKRKSNKKRIKKDISGASRE